MLANALIFLIETASGLFTLALLLRFLLQWSRAAPHNPISDFLNALTNFIVRPARRVVPGLWGLDLATLTVAWLVQLIELVLVLQLRGVDLTAGGAAGGVAILLLAAVMVLRFLIYIVIGAVIVQAVISWINPHSPIAPILNTLVRPLLRPFQKRIPPVANVDLSPLFVIIAFQLLLMLVVAPLEALLMGPVLAR